MLAVDHVIAGTKRGPVNAVICGYQCQKRIYQSCFRPFNLFSLFLLPILKFRSQFLNILPMAYTLAVDHVIAGTKRGPVNAVICGYQCQKRIYHA
jgi:uncharacterized Fe-S cluster-containing MiaB family protein